MGPVALGVDIGQRVDPTAIAVVEEVQPEMPMEWVDVGHGSRMERRPVGPPPPTVFMVRFLERLPLGTAYPKVAVRVADVVERVAGREAGLRPRLRVDVTGVGRPVLELIQAEMDRRQRLSCTAEAVTFTHGDRLTHEGGETRLGKAYLVSRLQALLQTDRLRLPRTAEARQLADELLNYEIKVDEDANTKYGAFRVGKHDDLVTALGLSVLEDLITTPSRQYGGLGHRGPIGRPVSAARW